MKLHRLRLANTHYSMIEKKTHHVIINEELSKILDKINGGDHIDSGTQDNVPRAT